MHSERLTAFKDVHRFKPDKVPALKRKSKQQVPPLTKKIFVIDGCWKRENQSSNKKKKKNVAGFINLFCGKRHGQHVFYPTPELQRPSQ